MEEIRLRTLLQRLSRDGGPACYAPEEDGRRRDGEPFPTRKNRNMIRLTSSLFLSAFLMAGLAGCSSPPSDGGGGAQAPDSGGGSIRLGMMPKSKGIPYFNACQKGAEEAAAELGDVELTWDGPSEDRSEAQSQMLESWLLRGFDALAVACNDPNQISGVLKRARDEGAAVVTYDADANPDSSGRQFFVNQATVDALGKALIDAMADQTGEAADLGVVSSSPTAPNQKAWLDAMDAYMKQKYPRLKIVVTEYAGENQKTSTEKTQSILKAYPNVKGIFGMTSVAFPGAAEAVQKAGKKGQVAVVGLGTPNAMKQYVKEGVVKTVVLWNPVDLGYLTVHVARAVKRGDLKPGDSSFKAGRLGEVEVKEDEVLLGKPMRFTAENIDQFDF